MIDKLNLKIRETVFNAGLRLVQMGERIYQSKRYQLLMSKRKQENLTEQEYIQLLQLTEKVENHQTQRLEYLAKLAQLRQQGNLITIWQIDQGKIIPRLITNWLEVYS